MYKVCSIEHIAVPCMKERKKEERKEGKEENRSREV